MTQDSFLEQHGLAKGGMALIDEQQAETLYQSSGPGLETSGGSVANTMVGIAQLGGRTGFIGRVRDDQLGSTGKVMKELAPGRTRPSAHFLSRRARVAHLDQRLEGRIQQRQPGVLCSLLASLFINSHI